MLSEMRGGIMTSKGKEKEGYEKRHDKPASRRFEDNIEFLPASVDKQKDRFILFHSRRRLVKFLQAGYLLFVHLLYDVAFLDVRFVRGTPGFHPHHDNAFFVLVKPKLFHDLL